MNGKASLVCFFLLLTLHPAASGQSAIYLGEPAPGLTPVKFAPDFISLVEQYEFGSVFSSDGFEFFYAVDHGNTSAIYYTYADGSVWTRPVMLLKNFNHGANDPMLSIDENLLYFISKAPTNPKDTVLDYNIWFAHRKDTHDWDSPQPLANGNAVNTNGNEYYISFTAGQYMYYASNHRGSSPSDYDIYLTNPDRTETIALPAEINTPGYEADVFVAPDGSYLIFCAIRNQGEGDLYISFFEKGKWTPAVNMGTDINTQYHELCPFVTRDGKYLFYTSNKDIYWVSALIIEKYRD